MLLSAVLIFFLLLGAVSAVDSDNVSIKEDSNLDDSVSTLSSQLEISNEVSISETNSQNDNLVNSSSLLSTINPEEDGVLKASDNEADDINTGDSKSSDNNALLSAKNTVNVPVNMTVKSAISDGSSTVFKVKLTDSETGNAITYKKVNLVLNGKTFVGTTDKNGVAKITTEALQRATYTVTLKFAGTESRYAATEVKQKVTVDGVPVKITVISAVSDDTSTIFNVKLTDGQNGDVLSDRKVNVLLDSESYVGLTDKNGVAQIATKSLQTGTYNIGLKFAGTISRYAATTTTQKVSVFKKVPVNMTVTKAFTDGDNTTFKVKLTDSSTGKGIGYQKVNLVLKGKTLVGTTDKNGVAKFIVAPLDKGTYNVTLKFAGTDSRYLAATVTEKVSVTGVPVMMTVVKAVSNSTTCVFKVKLTDSITGKILTDRKVNVVFDGKSFVGTTNKEGIAKIFADPMLKGTYSLTLKFAGTISRYAATTITQKVAVDGLVPVKMSVADTISDSDTVFEVKVTDSENGKAVSGYKVNLIINGDNLVGITDKKGIAKITTKSLQTATYTVTLKFAGTISRYAATTTTQKVYVFKKIPVVMTVLSADTNSDASLFKVKVTDSENGNAVSGYKVNVVVGGNSYVGVTDNNGVAQITAKPLKKDVYSVTLKFAGTLSRYTQTTVSKTVGVGVTKISLSNIIAASKNVKQYVEKNAEIPSSVTIGGISYTTPQYLYLAAQAIYNLKSGDKSDIYSKQIDAPSSPIQTGNLGNLYDYYSVAKNVVDYGNKNYAMPNYASSAVGNVGYENLVYAFSRVLTFYGDESIMPNYVVIKTLDIASSSNVNSKNTITNLAAYLAASTNCQVNNAQIKELAAKLTSGLSSDTAKATAIYNYVRDYISYTYYYDTKYGAVGTLNAKNGNCVDQAHLLVALYRASNLPARYVHGTCYFSLSGNTYGHVWTQVLIGNTWIVGDPTSTRNSFGSVVNWDTNSYTLHNYYASLPF